MSVDVRCPPTGWKHHMVRWNFLLCQISCQTLPLSFQHLFGNLPVHVLQDILDMNGHQNFNRAPGIGIRMIGTPWHPTRGIVDTLDGKFRHFCFQPDPMKNNEHFVGNVHPIFLGSCAQYGLPGPQACGKNWTALNYVCMDVCMYVCTHVCMYWCYVMLCCLTVRYITLHYVTLRYVTLRYVTLCYICSSAIGHTPLGSTCGWLFKICQVTESKLSPECPDERS